jgi:RNA polymerase sigma factor (sigma-70 family)
MGEPPFSATAYSRAQLQEFHTAVFRYTRRLATLMGLAIDPADIVQTVFEQFFKKCEAIKPGTELGWLCRAAELETLQQRRKELRESVKHRAAAEFQSGSEYQTTNPLEVEAISRFVLQRIDALPARQREVMRRQYIYNQSQPEIAAALGIKVSTVKDYAKEGRATIRAAVESLLEEWEATDQRSGGRVP